MCLAWLLRRKHWLSTFLKIRLIIDSIFNTSSVVTEVRPFIVRLPESNFVQPVRMRERARVPVVNRLVAGHTDGDGVERQAVLLHRNLIEIVRVREGFPGEQNHSNCDFRKTCHHRQWNRGYIRARLYWASTLMLRQRQRHCCHWKQWSSSRMSCNPIRDRLHCFHWQPYCERHRSPDPQCKRVIILTKLCHCWLFSDIYSTKRQQLRQKQAICQSFSSK